MSAFSQNPEGGPRLMNTVIDVGIIQKLAHKDIIALLQKCQQGEKALVWDRALANPINLIMKHTDLKELGVVRMLALEQGIIPGGEVPETIVFICRPLVSLMPLVASCIRNEEKARRRKKFHLFFLPRTSRLCTKWLEDEGVFLSITSVEELPIYLFPLDKDVLSMEQETAFKEFHIDVDPTGMYHIARALVFLQKTFGVPLRVFAKGNAATYVHSLTNLIKQESGPFKPQMSGAIMDHMIILDRQIDLLSPVVTQLTYEGLIDEFFGINNNQVKFPEEKFGEPKTMMLSSAEALYLELRDKNFSAVGGILRARTSEIQEIFKQKDRGEMSMVEMKRLVQQLPVVNALKQSLSDHTSIAELIKAKTETEEFLGSLQCEQELLSGLDTEKVNPHIESLCGKKAPINLVLRLIIIQCITSGGLKPKVMQHYERLIIQNYGFEHVLTLQRFNAIGLLRIQGGSRYSVLRKVFNLSRNDVSETKPDDFSYVHSIYAPLSIRLIQHRLQKEKWSLIRDSLTSLIPGPTIDEESDNAVIPAGVLSTTKRIPKITVIVFVGGCTYAEISALRFLAQQDDEREYLVVTSKIINGNTFLNGLSDNLLVNK